MELLTKIAYEFESKHQRKLLCSLVFDEMDIRQQVLWSLHQLDYIGYTGYTNYDQHPENEQNIVAKQAIVFVLNGIEVNFEFPMAYFFIESLKSGHRANLLTEIIKAVTRCGIRVTNLTFDGLPSNVPMCKLLGANLDVLSKDFTPFFHSPLNNIHWLLKKFFMMSRTTKSSGD